MSPAMPLAVKPTSNQGYKCNPITNTHSRIRLRMPHYTYNLQAAKKSESRVSKRSTSPRSRPASTTSTRHNIIIHITDRGTRKTVDTNKREATCGRRPQDVGALKFVLSCMREGYLYPSYILGQLSRLHNDRIGGFLAQPLVPQNSGPGVGSGLRIQNGSTM